MSTSKAASTSAKKNESNNGSGSSGTKGNVGDTATEAVGQVQETVTGLKDQVKQQASNQLTSRLETVTGGLDMAVKLLRTAGDQVREQDKAGVADSITEMADRMEGWSTSLREQDVDKLIDEAKQVAQRQPALFVGGAVALGFLGVRFLTSSAAKQQGESSSSSSGRNESSPSGASGDSTSSSPVGSDFDNTNPYSSAEENAALEASLEGPLERDDLLAFEDELTAPGLQDPKSGAAGSMTSSGER